MNTNASFLLSEMNRAVRFTGGNLGVGTASPRERLEISGGVGRFSGPAGAGTNGSVLITGRDSFGHSLYIGSAAPERRIGFNHNGTVGNIFSYNYGTLSAQDLLFQMFGGNVGIGNITPVYKLDVSGDVRANGIIVGGSGSYTRGSIYRDANWGMLLRSGTQNPTLAHFAVTDASDNNLLTISSTNGNVGIGTISPVARLHVSGGTLLSNGGESTMRSVGLTVSVNSGSAFSDGNDPGDSRRALSIIATGGSTFPSIICLRNVSTNPFWDIIMDPNDSSKLKFCGSNGTNALTLMTDGRVGVGTRNPATVLAVADGANDPAKYGSLQITQDNSTMIATTSNVAQISFIRAGNYVHGLGYLRNSNTFGFGPGVAFNTGTFSPSSLAIDASGNVGIGTVTPTERLHVNGNIYAPGVNRVLTVNYSAQSNMVFYPVVFDSDNATWVDTHYIQIDMPSQAGESAYNMHSMEGTVRSSSWTDQSSKYNVYHNFFITSERSILGVYGGARDFYGVVVYLRGGMTYRITTASRSVTAYTTAITLSASGSAFTCTFALKNSSFADVSGSSAHINLLLDLMTTPAGRYQSDNAYVANNLGIGTTSPTDRLHVIGTSAFDGVIRVKPLSGSTWGTIELNGASGSHIDFGPDSIDYRSRIIHVEDNRRLEFTVNGGTVAMTLASTGNVGIGTGSPAYRFDVNGEVIAEGWFRTRGNRGWYNETWGGGWYMEDSTWIRSVGTKSVWVDGTNAVLGTLGRIGIGLSSPTQMLHIQRSGSDNYIKVDAGGTGSNWCGLMLTEHNINWGWSVRHNAATDLFHISYQDTTPTFTNTVTFNRSGSVGIGIESPEQRLHVYGGRLRVEDPNNGILELKTNSNISYVFTESSGDLKLYPGDTSKHVLLQPGGGNVGIGNVSPSTKLHVSGNILCESISARASASTFGLSDSSVGRLGIEDQTTFTRLTFNQLNFWDRDSGDIAVFNAGGSSFSTNVGIGTGSPNARLEVNGNVLVRGGTGTNLLVQDTTANLEKGVIKLWDDHHAIHGRFNNSNGDVGFVSYYAYNGHAWYGGGQLIGSQTQMMRLNASGNLGIGTTNPTDRLHVAGSVRIDGATATQGAGQVDNNNRTNTYITFSEAGTSNDWAYLRQIGSSDNLKIALDIHDGGDEPGFCIRSVRSVDNPDTINERFTVTASGDVVIGQTAAVFYPFGGDKFVIHANGLNGGNGYFYYNAGNAYGVISDRRTKENINSLNKTESLDFVMKLNPVAFNMKDNTYLQAGFIAQDILNSATNNAQKSIIANWEKYDQSDPECPLLGVSDRPLISHLVAALQEVYKELQSTKAELEILKTRML